MGVLESLILIYFVLMTLVMGVYAFILCVSFSYAIVCGMWKYSIRGRYDTFKENFENILKQRKNK